MRVGGADAEPDECDGEEEGAHGRHRRPACPAPVSRPRGPRSRPRRDWTRHSLPRCLRRRPRQREQVVDLVVRDRDDARAAHDHHVPAHRVRSEVPHRVLRQGLRFPGPVEQDEHLRRRDAVVGRVPPRGEAPLDARARRTRPPRARSARRARGRGHARDSSPRRCARRGRPRPVGPALEAVQPPGVGHLHRAELVHGHRHEPARVGLGLARPARRWSTHSSAPIAARSTARSPHTTTTRRDLNAASTTPPSPPVRARSARGARRRRTWPSSAGW